MSHQHNSGAETRCTPLAENVCIRPFVHGGDPDVTDSKTGEIAGGPIEHIGGFLVAHDAPDLDARCEGAVHTDIEHPHPKHWTMTGSIEGGDLTLQPSVLCTRDQFHGFVRQGAWVPA